MERTRHALRVPLWAWCLVGLALSLLTIIEINAWWLHKTPVVFGDVGWYATALPAMLGDAPLYDPAKLGPHPMWGPPFWNQPPSLAPFTLLILLSPWAWVLVMVGGFIAGLLLVWPRVGAGATMVLMPLLLMWEPVQAAFVSANVNAVVFGLLALALRFPRWAGCAIGLAAAIKLVPIFGVAWLIGKRDWRGATMAAAVFVLLTSAVVTWKGAGTLTDFIAVRLNEYDPLLDQKFSLAALGFSPLAGYLAALVLAVLSVRFASFSLAVAAMLVSVPAPHPHYWVWLLVPLLGIGLPRLVAARNSRRSASAELASEARVGHAGLNAISGGGGE